MILTIVAIVELQAQTAPCATISNFTATCIKGSAPRKFSISFKISSNYLFPPGQSGTMNLATTNGTLNGNVISNGLNFTFNNSTAGATVINCIYEETAPNANTALGWLSFNMKLTGSNNNIICQTATKLQLPDCGNCTLTFATIDSSKVKYQYIGYPPNPSNGLLTIPFTAGPNKIASFTQFISKVSRRNVCGGVPQSYLPVNDTSVKIVDGMIQNPSTFIYSKINIKAPAPTLGLSFSGKPVDAINLSANMNGMINVKLPPKLGGATCYDEYTAIACVSYTDEFGCAKIVTKQIVFKVP